MGPGGNPAWIYVLYGEDSLRCWELMRRNAKSPDVKNFPALSMAYEAGKTGGSMPTVFNAANEYAVGQFLHRKIPYLAIVDMIQSAMESHQVVENPTVEQILEAERETYDMLKRRQG